MEKKDEELARLVEMKLRVWKEAQAGPLFLPPFKVEQLVLGGTGEGAGFLITPADHAKAKAMLLEKLKRAGYPEEKMEKTHGGTLSSEPAATEGKSQ
jgi:hypothetical protein